MSGRDEEEVIPLTVAGPTENQGDENALEDKSSLQCTERCNAHSSTNFLSAVKCFCCTLRSLQQPSSVQITD